MLRCGRLFFLLLLYIVPGCTNEVPITAPEQANPVALAIAPHGDPTDPRSVYPDYIGVHNPLVLAPNTVWLHSVAAGYQGDVFFRIRQTLYGPVCGICIYAFSSFYGACQCPPMPIAPQCRPGMLGYAEGITPPGLNPVTFYLEPNMFHHPDFTTCSVTISGLGLQGSIGFESVWGFTECCPELWFRGLPPGCPRESERRSVGSL